MSQMMSDQKDELNDDDEYQIIPISHPVKPLKLSNVNRDQNNRNSYKKNFSDKDSQKVKGKLDQSRSSTQKSYKSSASIPVIDDTLLHTKHDDSNVYAQSSQKISTIDEAFENFMNQAKNQSLPGSNILSEVQPE